MYRGMPAQTASPMLASTTNTGRNMGGKELLLGYVCIMSMLSYNHAFINASISQRPYRPYRACIEDRSKEILEKKTSPLLIRSSSVPCIMTRKTVHIRGECYNAIENRYKRNKKECQPDQYLCDVMTTNQGRFISDSQWAYLYSQVEHELAHAFSSFLAHD